LKLNTLSSVETAAAREVSTLCPLTASEEDLETIALDDVQVVVSPALCPARSDKLLSCKPAFNPSNVTDADPVEAPLVANALLTSVPS
jgi:hypothetical protein